MLSLVRISAFSYQAVRFQGGFARPNAECATLNADCDSRLLFVPGFQFRKGELTSLLETFRLAGIVNHALQNRNALSRS